MPRNARATMLCAALILSVAQTFAASRHPVRAEHGMVASAHPLASEAGVEMMRRGGNAVDAAVATALVAGVVEPYSAGIGGGGFMLVRDGKSGEIIVIDYRETAPAAATRDMYLDAKGDVVAGASDVGHLAVAVPGTVAGLYLAHKKFGKLKWRAVVEPAAKLAKDGFEVDVRYVEFAKAEKARLLANPEAAKIFLVNGEAPKLGARIVQRDLAKTLERIAKEGPDAFYQGKVPKAIAADMKAHGGLVTAKDLAKYRPREMKPLRVTWMDREIVTMPPPSSGGVHLIQILLMVEGAYMRERGWNSASYVHILAESMRRAYADRAEFLGDPAFVKVPVEGLTSQKYAWQRAGEIDHTKATPSQSVRHGDPARFESDHTTHLCTIDDQGYAVSLTQTINYTFGSGVVAPGTGILLNNEMDDFSAKPGVANLYGLVGNDANAIAPGKIPLSSMTPTMVLNFGKPELVVGSPGGARIITTVANVIMNIYFHDMDVQEAVDAPRFHHQWLPDEIRVEPRALSNDTKMILEKMGHKVSVQPVFGNAMAISVEPETGDFLGAADSRGVGAAKGY